MKPSRALLVTAILVACASAPPGFSARGVENLESSPEPRAVDLFFVEAGTRVECDSCVIVEIVEGRERSAYFVQTEPSCTFLPIHSNGTRGGYDRDGGYSVGVSLNDRGIKEVSRCLRNSRPSHGSSRFVVVVDGEAVATTFVSDYDAEFSLLFFHGTGRLEAVDRALAAPPVEPQEI